MRRVPADEYDLDAAAGRPEALAAQYRDGDNLRARVSLYRYLQPETELRSGFEPCVLEHRNSTGEELVLDIGCGPGPYLEALAEQSGRVLACDLSMGMLAEARRCISSDGSLVVADAQELPLLAGSIDVVLGAHMLYHVRDVRETLEEFRRVLKPSGTLLLTLNGMADKIEIRSTWQEAGTRVLGREFGVTRWGERANLGVTPELVNDVFGTASVDRLPGVFRFPSVEPPLTWIKSVRDGTESAIDDDEWAAVLAETAATFQRAIDVDGELRVTKDSGVIVATR